MGMSEANQMGITLDCGDFLVVRPRKNYRITSSVIIVKGTRPVIIDTGTPFDPGISRIRRALLEHGMPPASVGTILITHAHADHVHNLQDLQKLCPNSRTWCHAREKEKVIYPARLGKVLKSAFALLDQERTHRFLELVTAPALRLAYRKLDLDQRVDQTFDLSPPEGDLDLALCPRIQAEELTLTAVPTPGHSSGHTSYLDSRGNLFLGDFVPFTPWISPVADGLDDMIRSIQHVLSLGPDQVTRAVRAHGDFRRKSWEVWPWDGPDGERARFQLFYETIHQTLERIPSLVADGPLDTFALTGQLLPNFERYNRFMRRWFLPPGVTWTMAYCLKLERSGALVRQRRGKKTFWTGP